VDFVTHYTSQGAYQNITDIDPPRLDRGVPMERPTEASILLCEDHGSVPPAARGVRDRAYTAWFRALATGRPADLELWIGLAESAKVKKSLCCVRHRHCGS
jgi:hypothetical protein